MYDSRFRNSASLGTSRFERACSPAILIATDVGSGDSSKDPGAPFVSTTTPPRPEGFHWGRALFESFVFLAIEQAYVVHDDYRWVVSENGVPFNHYGRDYKQSLNTWVNAGWDDGDNPLYSYVGHPIQGALTEYIQIQNDPHGAKLEISNTKAYWRSRFKAFLWNAVYSTLWNIGPLSEVTVEKYGTKDRTPWNKDGTWPCTKPPCVTGVGQVDLVMTPIGGTGWLLGEELLDKEIVRRLEGVTQNHFLIDVTQCALNPIRGGANILHGKRPGTAPPVTQRKFTSSINQRSGPRKMRPFAPRAAVSLRWCRCCVSDSLSSSSLRSHLHVYRRTPCPRANPDPGTSVFGSRGRPAKN